MDSLVLDVRHAVRTLARAPIFTVIVVVTLALGIGANSAIFSLVNAALIRPLGYMEPERLMAIYEGMPDADFPRFIGMSPPDFEDLARHQRSFTAIGAYRIRPIELSGTGEPEQLRVAQVTSELFAVLGVSAMRGRTLGAEDVDDPRVVVLSHGLWQRRFGSADVLGQRVILSRQPYTIVGVMPAGFQFPKWGQDGVEPADLWMPLRFTQFERQARGQAYNHGVIGRLRDGVTVDQAAAEMAAMAGRVYENYPARMRRSGYSLTVTAVPLADEVAGQVRRPLLVLLGAVGLVLLVACANVANLMLSRAVVRERDIGLRLALGAGRTRLFQMQLVESLILATLAGGLGILIGHWSVRAIPSVISSSLPGVSDVQLDGRVVSFAVLLSVLTAVIFSLVPLLAGRHRSLIDLSREGGRSVGGSRRQRVQGSLVVGSVALAFVLLVGAGLLSRSLANLLAVDVGVRVENVLTLRVSLPFAAYNNATSIRSFYRSLHERLEAIPGVRAASISSDIPLVGDGERRAFTPERVGDAGGLPPSVAVTWVRGDHFGTFGIPVLGGRTLLPEEETENRLVALVSRGLASRFWPGEDPVGKRLRWGLATDPQNTSPWMNIVGVVGDVVDGPLGAEPIFHVYVPYSEVADQWLGSPLSLVQRTLTVAIRSDTDLRRLVAPVRSAIASLDPALAVTDVQTLADVAANASAPQRFSASVLGTFAVGALVIAAVGLYGVLAFGVSQRTREIGVRIALGAEAPSVVGLIVRHGMLLTGGGIAAGAAGAVVAARFLRTIVYETSIYDPLTLVIVPVVLALVALVACYLPARRAARIDPVVALRTE
jgi:putative ABC transport system permease protein